MNPQHLIAQIDKPIYLHFLNRELLSPIINYNSDSIRNNILMDVRLTLLMGDRHCYLSPSLIFEDRFARLVINQFPNLFQEGHIRLSSNYYNICEFIDEKKEQYSHAQKYYPFYFNDTYKKIEDVGLIYQRKDTDTSLILTDNIKNKLHDKNNSDQLLLNLKLTSSQPRIDGFKPYAIEAIEKRGNFAVTGLLFENDFNKHDLQEKERKYFDLIIVEQYIISYLLDFNGVIATNLLSGINHFNYLATEFPFYDISLWQYIYDRLGCIDFIRKCSDIEIISIREEPIYKKFINTIRLCINEAVNSIVIDTIKISNTAKIEKIKSQLSGNLYTVRLFKKSKNIDDFLENLNLATEILESHGFKIEVLSSNVKENCPKQLNQQGSQTNNYNNCTIFNNSGNNHMTDKRSTNINNGNYNESVDQSRNFTTGNVGGDLKIEGTSIMNDNHEITEKNKRKMIIISVLIFLIPVFASLFGGLFNPETRQLLKLDHPIETKEEK